MDKSRNKYNLILTQNFLKEGYIEKKKSISQIAKELKIDWATVKKYLQSHKIKLRTHKEQAAISSPGRQYKYNNFLTEHFFIEHYLNSKNSIKDLSKKFSIDRSIISKYMKKLNITIRTCHEQKNIMYPPKEFSLTEECLIFFDGLLAGDGSVPKRFNGKARSYSQGCKYKEYLEYIVKRSSNYGITFSPVRTRWIKDSRCKKKGYFLSFLQSHRYKTFELLRRRWYDEGGMKRIPQDFKFSPDSLLQLYLSDGNFYKEIRLCVSGFAKPDVIFLKRLIEKNLNIKTRLTNSEGPGKDIIIKKSDTKKFLFYIGSCPIKCYEYKWKDNMPKEQRLKYNQRAREIYHSKKAFNLNDIS